MLALAFFFHRKLNDLTLIPLIDFSFYDPKSVPNIVNFEITFVLSEVSTDWVREVTLD